MAFYQKYRSKNFSELIGQNHIVTTLLEALKTGRTVHAYLLTGPRGTGKTSTARLLAKAINCEKLAEERKDGKENSGEPCNECSSCLEITAGRAIDVLEIDAASHTGVDEIREVIEQARLAPARLRKKVYIIDEVHMLSKSAFNALLKTLEEPPEHAVFIMATTEVHKIPATILSRAQRFDFKRASIPEITENLKRVAKSEGLKIGEDSLEIIAVAAAGGHRDALSLLEKAGSQKGEITIEKTRQILGIAEEKEIDNFLRAIFNEIPEEGLKIARALFESGYDLAEFNRSVVETLRKILVLKIAGATTLGETKERTDLFSKIAEKKTALEILSLISIFIESGQLLKDINYPVLPVEMAVVKSCNIANQPVSQPAKQPNSQTASKQIEDTAVISSGQSSVERSSGKKDIFQQDQGDTKRQPSPAPSEAGDRNDDGNQPVNGLQNHSTDQPANQTVPVPVVEMTVDIWEKVITETKKYNNTLAALLKDAKPIGMTDDKLSLQVKFKFHKDRISEQKNCVMLEKIVQEVTGRPLRISCKMAEKEKPEEKKINDKLEETITEVFEVM